MLRPHKIFFILIPVLFAAPWWVPSLQVINGRNMFLQVDTMVSLGIAFTFAIICSRALPSGLLNTVDGLLIFVKKWFALFGIAALAITLFGLYFINQNVLHSFLNSADEHSCYFLAESLRLGRLWVESPDLSEFFNVVHVGNRDGKWFSVYPLGWPLIWALGIQLGAVDWLNPVMSTIAVFFFYQAGKRVFGFHVAWIAMFLMLLTPFFKFTAASYFSHGTCLLMVSIFFYSYVRWQASERNASRLAWAILMACAIGYGMMTRYLTMAVIAGPFLVYHYWPLLIRKRSWKRDEVVIVVILVLFFASVLYQNYVVTGKPLKAPNKYDKSWERLGFRGDYTPLDGILYLIARFLYLMDWFPAILVAFFLGTVFQKKEATVQQKIARYVFFYPAIAYFFYYSWGGNQYGPRYYYEGTPFLCFAIADRFKAMWDQPDENVKKFLLGIVLSSFILTGYVFQKQTEYFETVTRERKQLYVKAENEVRKPAIVFIQGFLGDRLVMAQEDAVRNAPSLDGEILYAHHLGAKNQVLMAKYPNRNYYLGSYDRAQKIAKLKNL